METETPEVRRSPLWARALLTTALVLAFAPAVVIVIGAVGTKLGLWSWQVGFAAVLVRGPFGIGWAPALAILAIAVSLISVVVSIWTGSWRRSLAALLISLATMAAFIIIAGRAREAPPIHDVSTNWEQPLSFSPEVMAERGDGSNPVVADPVMAPQAPAFGGQRVADINARTCPGARPVLLDVPVDEAYARTRAAIEAEGLDIVTDDPDAGRLEAVATSFWYGFKDDLVARITPSEDGARVDFRSVSRVGMSDLGVNCERITSIAERLGAQPAGS